MRRFELVEGTSCKFWEVSVTDAELTVRFGRIGTQGQSKSKTFASAQAAQQEEAKLIREKIAQVAEARGLTPEELADRLVPDLGLDDNGTLVLDFGPRQFFVGFDESLKPFVKDADGSRLKDLPKPNQKDHPELSAAAVERYKAMKKDAKAIASLQLIRLEQGMCGRRRWSPAQFRQFFLEHPLMRHLARRLVWGVYRDRVLADAFRVAEDLSLANREDDLYELLQEVEIGVAHVLEMDPVLKGEFGQIFADYEILQPFRQLGRETYTLTEAEQKSGEITRFKDRVVGRKTCRPSAGAAAEPAGHAGMRTRGVFP